MRSMTQASLPSTSNKPLILDSLFPGGNIVLDRMDQDLVELHPDLRDTEGGWFYWCFRLRQAAGRHLHFRFTQQAPIAARGPAVSLDAGETWRWLGLDNCTDDSFSYSVPPDAAEVRFSLGMTYTARHLDKFLQPLAANPHIQITTLCQSRKGRPVRKLLLGNSQSNPRYRVLITARHHACEMMASYELEGLLEAILADQPAGRWLRDHVAFMVVPFVDWDGVEDGDQGKNRLPCDHNRDYDGTSIHPETAAIRQQLPPWHSELPLVLLDLHCPWIRSGCNEQLYQVGHVAPEIWAQQQQFGRILQQVRRGPIPYRQDNDMPFGKEWNTQAGWGNKGLSATRWIGGLPGTLFASSIELPYANAQGVEVNAASARSLGHDLAHALQVYLANRK